MACSSGRAEHSERPLRTAFCMTEHGSSRLDTSLPRLVALSTSTRCAAASADFLPPPTRFFGAALRRFAGAAFFFFVAAVVFFALAAAAFFFAAAEGAFRCCVFLTGCFFGAGLARLAAGFFDAGDALRFFAAAGFLIGEPLCFMSCARGIDSSSEELESLLLMAGVFGEDETQDEARLAANSTILKGGQARKTNLVVPHCLVPTGTSSKQYSNSRSHSDRGSNAV